MYEYQAREPMEIINERREARRKLAEEIRDIRITTNEAIRRDGLTLRRRNELIRHVYAPRIERRPKLTAERAKAEAEICTDNAIRALSADISHLPCGADDAAIERAQALREMAIEMQRVYIRLAVEEERRRSGARGYW